MPKRTLVVDATTTAAVTSDMNESNKTQKLDVDTHSSSDTDDNFVDETPLQMTPTIHYRDANILVLGLFRMDTPIVQVCIRRTEHLWTASYHDDALLLWPTQEVLICDPEPVFIGRFESCNGDNTINLYREYHVADEVLLGKKEMPICGGLRPQKLCEKYPGELGRLTRLITRYASAEEWAKAHGREVVWDDLNKYHFEEPVPKRDQ